MKTETRLMYEKPETCEIPVSLESNFALSKDQVDSDHEDLDPNYPEL